MCGLLWEWQSWVWSILLACLYGMRHRLKATKDKEVVVRRHLLQTAVMQTGLGRVDTDGGLGSPM